MINVPVHPVHHQQENSERVPCLAVGPGQQVSLQILLPGNDSGNDSTSLGSSVQKSILTENSDPSEKLAEG